MTKRIGALVIGQAPRPDLTGPLAALLSESVTLIEAGALDTQTAEQLPPIAPTSTYPLSTRMADGTLVRVEEAYVAELLQPAVGRLEAEGVCAIILLCAGTFASLRSRVPLIKPFAVGQQLLLATGYQNVGFITPVAGQEPPIAARWQAAGFTPTVWHADLERQDSNFRSQLSRHVVDNDLDCILLDYVGLPNVVLDTLKQSAPVPVIDLGALANGVMASLVA